MNAAANEIVTNPRVNKSKTTTTKSFEYKTKVIGSTPAYNNTLDTESVIPLKHLSNFGDLLIYL